MSLRYSTRNLMQDATVTTTNANALLPATYLYDGTGLACAASSEVSPWNITVDLGEVPTNGGFETAFVGGLPAAGWAKSSGATLSQSAFARTGVGAMRALGPTDDFASYDFTVRPSQPITFQVGSRVAVGGSGAATMVRVRNLTTGNELQADGSWLATSNPSWAAFHTHNTTTYAFTSAAATVEAPESGPPTMTLRATFRCDEAGGDSSIYDDVALYSGVNFASIHWHNLVGGGDGPRLRSSTDNFSGVDTSEALFTVARPAFYAVLASTVYRRYWRFTLVNDTLRLNGGAIPYIGEAWLGYAAAAARAQDYGWTLEPTFQQVRTMTPFGAEAVYRGGTFEQRRLRLAFKPSSSAEFRELRDRIFRQTYGGADPLVIVPYDSDDVVIHGRLENAFPHSRELVSRWDTSLSVLETTPTMIVS